MNAINEATSGGGYGGNDNPYPYLDTLNERQTTAVTYPPDGPLQVLAGPGSGKTKVLTCRVAYLVHHHHLRPDEIVAVTFTNKAALEMKKRLNVLLGEPGANKLVLGTFHSTCVKYLRRYGKSIGLNNNFSIMDYDDAKKMMANFIKPIAQALKEVHIVLKADQVLSEISNAKAKGETPGGMRARAEALGSGGQLLSVMADLYEEYEKGLRAAGSLDFDDLLGYGLKLLRQERHVLNSVKHVLVDEFQDTNTTQYELMRLFAKEGNVTIVGDPDQAIYGWRAADYPNTVEVHLEQNYRSTGAILDASLAIVKQGKSSDKPDKKRIQKGLYTAFGSGVPVTLKQTSNGFNEAEYIADEIKRLIAHTGNLLTFDDFAILLRYNALSRILETTLQKHSIPTRLVGGRKFFERLEVKDVLGYLQLINNPQYHPAFIRVINVPKRSIGEKTLQGLLDRAKEKGLSAMDMTERIADGEDSYHLSMPVNSRKNLVQFVDVIRKLRVQAKNCTRVPEIIESVLEETGYEAYLRRTHADFDTRWENVKELAISGRIYQISYSVTISQEQEARNETSAPASQSAPKKSTPTTADVSTSAAPTESSNTVPRGKKRKATGEASSEAIDLEYAEEEDIASPAADIPAEEEADDSENIDIRGTPLRVFLEASMLATDAQAQDENAVIPRVTICTVHAAKGLEWPVVFVPAVEKGVYPFIKSTEEAQVNEEMRLLYVAMTRAQAVLQLTFADKRMAGKQEIPKELSPFVAACRADGKKSMFEPDYPVISREDRELIASVIGRKPRPEKEAAEIIHAYIVSIPAGKRPWELPWASDTNWRAGGAAFYHNSHNKEHRAQEYWDSERDEYQLPDMEQGSMRSLSQTSGVPAASQPASVGFVSASQFRTQAGLPAAQSLPPAANKASEKMRLATYSQPIFSGSQRASNEVAPQPFSFGKPADMSIPVANGGSPSSFRTAQSAQVNNAIMKNIGLPPPITALTSNPPAHTGFAPAGLNSFQNFSSSSLASLKNLGMPDVKPAVGAAIPKTAGPRPGQPLRRLGMGRPAPYGSPKPAF
ncbi:hypothetical protein QFC22_002509 [Naganishia vaughanmartiniae]|uniref:Uncharacterized protein n=1 Tax=Naganishia vaughanmartiniae TaxID=1424756 RepID=A0ACC2X971_9TREE|nr:hypothetical protein QFC22_002509 [Naganishia vaughanmartiniae]